MIFQDILRKLGLIPTPVEIAPMLDEMAARRVERLDWRHSVVDLMKLLDIDSGLDVRVALAAELGYPGDSQHLDAMNRWLHAEIMRRVAENGGRVPSELL